MIKTRTFLLIVMLILCIVGLLSSTKNHNIGTQCIFLLDFLIVMWLMFQNTKEHAHYKQTTKDLDNLHKYLTELRRVKSILN